MKLFNWQIELLKDLIDNKVILVKTRMGYQFKTINNGKDT
jgi:hypothetical protein